MSKQTLVLGHFHLAAIISFEEKAAGYHIVLSTHQPVCTILGFISTTEGEIDSHKFS